MFNKYSCKTRIQSTYCYTDTETYINYYGITDSKELNKIEADLTHLRISELYLNSMKGRFGPAHLKKIHKYIFQDIYPFAGTIRKEDISKGDTQFCFCQFIESNLDNLLDKLKSDQYLKNCTYEEFIKKIAYYMSELNIIHPFREGNGRTIREFIRQLAIKNGYTINWFNVDSDLLLKATILAVDYNMTQLEECIRLALDDVV